MSILIKGMRMPKDCYMCPMCHRAFDGNETRLACYALKTWCFEEDGKLDNCPLVEVKTPHGDLIDSSEIRWVEHHDSYGNLSKYMVAYSDEMPQAVIEAEGET